MIQWVKFWLLAAIWGSSFLLIKVGVEEMGALPLVSIRLGGAAILFSIYLMMTGRRLPIERSQQYAIVFVGIFNTAVPFFLISWGETKIDSGLATVLNGTVPLFGLIYAHFQLADDRLTPGKIAGVLIGFIGVVILTSQSLGNATDNPLVGQLAVLAASVSYAVSIITVRRYLRKVDPFTVAGTTTIIGGILIVLVTLLVVNPLPSTDSVSLKAFSAAVTLAAINTFIAYFLFYDLIDKWGARSTLVTYAMPPIGVTLGVLLLDEKVGWQLLVGGTLIIGGIVLAKAAPQPKASMAAAIEATGQD